MKKMIIELGSEAHKELLKVQFAMKLDEEENTALTVIMSDIVNTVLTDEALRKAVLEKKKGKK